MEELLRECLEKKTWETDKTFNDRQQFITYLLDTQFTPRRFTDVKALSAEEDGALLISRVAALSQSYYNAKYLKCSYDDAVMEILQRFPGFNA